MTEKKSACIALYFYSLEHAGGAEKMICMLANHLVDSGFKVLLISYDSHSVKPFFPLKDEVKRVCLGFKAGLRDKCRRFWNLYACLKRNEVGVVVGFVMSLDKVVYLSTKLSFAKLIVAERNAPEMYFFRYGWIDRVVAFLLLRLADAITVQAPSFVAKYPDAVKKRISVIPNPISVADEAAASAPSGGRDGYILLAVGRLDGLQKRFHLLLSAFSQLAKKYPQWNLRIVGSGPAEASLKEFIKSNDLSERVEVLEAKASINEEYVNANLFVIPSLWEGFPNALAEAMSHGLPVVGYRSAPGVSDLIEGAGWLAYGEDDVKSLKEVLDKAMFDENARREMGMKALIRVQEFSPNDQLNKWVELIGGLCGEARA